MSQILIIKFSKKNNIIFLRGGGNIDIFNKQFVQIGRFWRVLCKDNTVLLWFYEVGNRINKYKEKMFHALIMSTNTVWCYQMSIVFVEMSSRTALTLILQGGEGGWEGHFTFSFFKSPQLCGPFYSKLYKTNTTLNFGTLC